MIILKIIFSLFKEMILCFKPNLKKMFVIICVIIILSWLVGVAEFYYVFLLNTHHSEPIQFLLWLLAITIFILGLPIIFTSIEKTKDKFNIFDK